ncbi:MAG: glutathione S-transferase N-terminal domain-containing protein [Hyphomicrobiaceae bacterium]|nr:glutathione S-transferase N-terminal domain-containing protein [Hyphomicrobiaceae bacterium]
MRLLYAPASPFARKVRIVAGLKGLAGRIAIVQTDAGAQPAELVAANPLGKIPALILDDGVALFDSFVISDYLDGLVAEPRLIPAQGRARSEVLRLAALADGIVEAALLVVYEERYRGPGQRSEDWVRRQQDKVERGLAALTAAHAQWPQEPDYGQVAVAAALGYLDLRQGGRWRALHTGLAAWLTNFAARVPDYDATSA